MAELALDVVEQILIPLDVEDLIRCKSVCKSWQSLISSPCFDKAHLNHAYKSDRDNHELGHRRVSLDVDEDEDTWFIMDTVHILGSCNGLLCVSPRRVRYVVTNPSTREHRKLPSYVQENERIRQIVCMGFGYDSCADDYKVIVGLMTNVDSPCTRFHVLSLKSNTWKFIGEVKYRTYVGTCGILCGGALYWVMAHKSRKKVIISLDLSTDEFKEISLPDVDLLFEYDYIRHRLGVIEECLCIYSYGSALSTRKWVMKNSKWEVYIEDHCQGKYDVVHYLPITSDSQSKRVIVLMTVPECPSMGNIFVLVYLSTASYLPIPILRHHNNNNHCEGQKRNVKQEQEDTESVESGAKGHIRKKEVEEEQEVSKHKKPLV